MINKNNSQSLLDIDQMSRAEHDVNNDAKRVIIVGGDATQIAEAVRDGLKDLQINVPAAPVSFPQMQVDPLVIKIPYQTVIKETEVVTIEKPVYITDIKIVEVPTIVIQKEIEFVQMPQTQTQDKPTESKLMHWLLIFQTGASIILSIMHFLHK